VVDGHHPAHLRARQRPVAREPRAPAGQRRPPRRRAHADTRPLRCAGRRGDGCLRIGAPGRRPDRRGAPRRR
jgi:hypothetical protein